MGKREAYTIKLEPEVMRLVKIEAARRDLTIGELVETFILRGLREMGAKP